MTKSLNSFLCISQDLALVRMHRGLQKRIEREGGLACQTKYWAGAWEVEEIFNALPRGVPA